MRLLSSIVQLNRPCEGMASSLWSQCDGAARRSSGAARAARLPSMLTPFCRTACTVPLSKTTAGTWSLRSSVRPPTFQRSQTRKAQAIVPVVPISPTGSRLRGVCDAVRGSFPADEKGVS